MESKYNVSFEQLIAPEETIENLSDELKEQLIAKIEEDDETKEEEEIKRQEDEEQQTDRFNDMGKNIRRDNKNYVAKNKEIIDLINSHEYAGDVCGKVLYYATCCVMCATSRRTVEDGHFGHYMSSERHMFTSAGVHALDSCTDMWLKDIPIDDQHDRENPNNKDTFSWGRKLGSKYLVTVPENHLGGCFRIGKPEDSPDAEDGQFVLLKKGRHVLDAYKYKKIMIASLERRDERINTISLGPITVLYLKEGQLGGAFDIWEGVYKIFYPGKPVLLHEQDFRNISSVKTSLEPYHLGPYTFVTVQDGKLAGAYNKTTGEYQILPPGNTYWLHSKEWVFNKATDVVQVTERFNLGPWMYLTVVEGSVAGVFHKKTGEFVELPEGNSYRMSREDYEEPIQVRKDSHKVECGPITLLTVENGFLNGGYNLKSGKFQEFDDPDQLYRLHSKEYRDIVTIPKYRNDEQRFGFFKVITIPEGSVGVFEKNGKIQPLNESAPGYYKLTPDYRILPTMSVNTITMSVPKLEFKTKDGITMACNASLVWCIDDARKTAVITPSRQFLHEKNPSFGTVRNQLERRLKLSLIKHVMKYNRDELLPTKQDVALKLTDATAEELDEALASENKKTESRYLAIEGVIKEELVTAVDDSKWGVNIDTVKLEGFELDDYNISTVLDEITATIIAIDREKAKGEYSLAEEEQNKQTQTKEAEMKASVQIEKAKATSLVKKAEAEAAADVLVSEAKTNAQDAVNKAETENAAKVALASKREQASAQARETRLKVENDETLSAAEADAQSINVLAIATYDRQVKENEAAEKMSQKAFDLELSRKSVKAMNHLAVSAWRMPDKVLEFYEQFNSYLEQK